MSVLENEVQTIPGLLVTIDQIQGYAAMQKEEVSQTIALLQITLEQIEQCDTVAQIEVMFDNLMRSDATKPLPDYVERRICRAITLVSLMSSTPIPPKFVMIDEIVVKATGILLSHQQELQAGDTETQTVAETTVQ